LSRTPAVGVLLQDSPCFVRSHVHIGRFHRFTGKCRHCGSQLLMKEARHGIVVRDITQWALAIAEMQFSGAELMTIVATKRCDMERVDQLSHRSIALRPELHGGNGNNISPLLAPEESVVIRQQNICHD